MCVFVSFIFSLEYEHSLVPPQEMDGCFVCHVESPLGINNHKKKRGENASSAAAAALVYISPRGEGGSVFYYVKI